MWRSERLVKQFYRGAIQAAKFGNDDARISDVYSKLVESLASYPNLLSKLTILYTDYIAHSESTKFHTALSGLHNEYKYISRDDDDGRLIHRLFADIISRVAMQTEFAKTKAMSAHSDVTIRTQTHTHQRFSMEIELAGIVFEQDGCAWRVAPLHFASSDESQLNMTRYRLVRLPNACEDYVQYPQMQFSQAPEAWVSGLAWTLTTELPSETRFYEPVDDVAVRNHLRAAPRRRLRNGDYVVKLAHDIGANFKVWQYIVDGDRFWVPDVNECTLFHFDIRESGVCFQYRGWYFEPVDFTERMRRLASLTEEMHDAVDDDAFEVRNALRHDSFEAAVEEVEIAYTKTTALMRKFFPRVMLPGANPNRIVAQHLYWWGGDNKKVGKPAVLDTQNVQFNVSFAAPFDKFDEMHLQLMRALQLLQPMLYSTFCQRSRPWTHFGSCLLDESFYSIPYDGGRDLLNWDEDQLQWEGGFFEYEDNDDFRWNYEFDRGADGSRDTPHRFGFEVRFTGHVPIHICAYFFQLCELLWKVNAAPRALHTLPHNDKAQWFTFMKQSKEQTRQGNGDVFRPKQYLVFLAAVGLAPDIIEQSATLVGLANANRGLL